MSKNLIYANADEFHVKSTVVYAKVGDFSAPIATDNGGESAVVSNPPVLYWDPEFTKPVYNDELERLFLAGGMKIYSSKDELFQYMAPIFFTSAIPGNEDHNGGPASVGVTLDSSTTIFCASFRENSSKSEENGMAPVDSAHHE